MTENTIQHVRRLIIIGIASLLTVNHNSHARQDFLTAWESIYPESTSGERGCQLCHQSSSGGDGWNSYGITVRSALRDIYGGFDINAAIIEVEQENADLDSQGLTNRQEIEQGLDPGWVAGNKNDITFKSFEVIFNQPAPFSDVDGGLIDEELLCFPVKEKKGTLAVVCL